MMNEMASISAQHAAEVKAGQRFEFGKNWSRFLSSLTEQKILLAEASLTNFLSSNLDGLRFIDIGSGSGLFSLAARRLGATVFSFDYDSNSVNCTNELRQRYFPGDPNWTVEQASALDRDYVANLGTFDIVYSWGVLHHTGRMWEALDNIKPLVRDGGELFIAIYNDQKEITDQWKVMKARYNRLPKTIALLYAMKIIAQQELRTLGHFRRAGNVRGWIDSWRNYDKISLRGMNRWHDWIDWIGGHPYECASLEEIVDWYSRDGFKLTKVKDRSNGIGCNEFVFTRVSPAGTYVDNKLTGGSSMARRYGLRVHSPFELTPDGWIGRVTATNLVAKSSKLLLLQDAQIVGPVAMRPDLTYVIASPNEDAASVSAATFFLIAAERIVLAAPFSAVRANSWKLEIPQLAKHSDTSEQPRRCDCFVFEDGVQLAHPHAMHDEIAEFGNGRFSFWGKELLFSPSRVGENPNHNGRTYELLYPVA